MSKDQLSDPNLLDTTYIPTPNPIYLQEKETVLSFLAMDIYIYGYPLVLVEVTKRTTLSSGSQLNQFLNERTFPTPRYTTIVRPNVDTLYSMAWLDLTREPILLHVPDTHQRYYLMELLDAWTNVFTSIGARTTGTREGTFAITGPTWNGLLPEGVIRASSPNNTVWIIGRTQTNGPKDYPLVHAIQDDYTLMPLSSWRRLDPQSKGNYGKRPINISPADQVTHMDAATFFQTMMRAMAMNPPWIEDPEMNRKLAALGLIPNKTFDFFRLTPPVQQALQLAVANGPGLIKTGAGKITIQNNIHGWTLLRNGMGFYGADYRQRAAVAMIGIGANLPPDSVYAPAFVDADGLPLVGYKNYRIHFNQGQLPPVHAFWSITVYNDQGYLVENPIHRYAISPHLGKLNYNRDGSLDLFIGNVAPEKEYLPNWLPAPKSSFNLIMRMYWPNQPVLKGEWNPPAIIRI